MAEQRGARGRLDTRETDFKYIPSDSRERIRNYLNVITSEHDLIIHHIGDWTNGEIEIVTDPLEIVDAEGEMKEVKAPLGTRPDSVLEAFVVTGGYSTFIQHVVKRRDDEDKERGFSYGVFQEVVWNFERRNNSGHAAFPVWTDEDGVKRVCLVKIFRRPTGTWEAEIPRFSQDAIEEVSETRQRELMEETKCEIVGDIVDLGTGLVDSGLAHLENHLWYVPVEPLEVDGDLDAEEGIADRVFLTLDEVKDAILTREVSFGDEKVSMRDGGLLMVWAAANVRGLI